MGRNGRVLANGELAGLFADLNQSVSNAEASLAHESFRNSGCTASIAVVTPTRSLRGAWLGDCQCLAGYGHRAAPDVPALSKDRASRILTPPHVATGSGFPPPRTRCIGNFSQEGLGREAEEFVEADIDHAGL